MSSPSSPPPRLSLLNITKRYPGVVANAEVSLSVMPGEIHAVLGENGAGKSTLMKIIYGAVHADEGEILCNGRQVHIANPAAARQLGIGMVFQHFQLFETLTVVENIALALEGKFDLRALAGRVREVSARYGLPLDPERLVHSLSVGERQRVEIVRCLLQNPQLLILDEPTSVLTPQAVRTLFETLRKLASEGVSILYISHKLHEIQDLCDRATVMRGGRVTGETDPRQESAASLARMMIGRELPVCESRPYAGEVSPVLEVRGLNYRNPDPFSSSLHDISFTVHAGEVLGIAGISGNGQAELLAALSGEHVSAADAVRIAGQSVGNLHAGRRRDLGLAFVPEERLGRGAVPGMALAQNYQLTAHRQPGLSRYGLLDSARALESATHCIERFDVRCNGAQAPARSLSGGNLQKFIVGREVLQTPRVMIVAQPTWGVDVGAAAFLRQTLIDVARSGVAVLVISEELEELFEICDSIAVLAGGQLSAPVPREQTDAEQIGLLMAGTRQQAA
ncbi:MAG: ABC transporter [Candidatus Dactylopiibacterium carminicum]|uniref:ABC transporter n=1 Tax=Candidatus Dactylopiibacterium carminicum TaxID=857335 RepID=A0A272ER10_9RHOO|nr:ABC transporter ATP-binding protein [Candidatus Dactylopiibacterium carminicum]KAF7598694.1 ABC transporter ATP-binding protein [Candidatus Dactylopiibacterium carminicum]PAS92511.1 MAG: ABC transporter [Candidatus Dactylopiibacterium carminicum]PAS96308.1 MAG: ABC transporter [Candidatus Dactylopiibacterium carminicum]PAS98561.1 MAG: ABC transporter [Candidatus Dactylopiibacterium carminicum]